MTKPRSPFPRPVAFIRGMWAAMRGADAAVHDQRDGFSLDDDDWDDASTWSDDEAAEHGALVEMLHEDPSVKGIQFDSTAPAVVTVYLDPWSEASAQWVRDVCLPRDAQLKTGRAPWLDSRDDGCLWD